MSLLFSYGTLQEENVQLSTFGRKLTGHKDYIVGFEQSRVLIADRSIVTTNGKTHHQNVEFNGNSTSRVEGTVFEVTDMELQYADKYEDVAKYKRIAATLASGTQAWVYVYARSARNGP